MERLFPAMHFLYLHDSAVDLYLKSLREAISSIPHEVLQAEISCKPIIIDYSDTREGEDCGIVLGYGFHQSEFDDACRYPRHPLAGLAFCLNPPHAPKVGDIRIYNTKHISFPLVRSSFMIGKNRFILTDEEFDLDKTWCCELNTGERYEKPKPCEIAPKTSEDIPF